MSDSPTTPFASTLPSLQEMLADEATVDRAVAQVQAEAQRRGVRPAHVLLFELAAMRSRLECGK